MSDEQEHRSTLVQRLRDYGVYRDVAPSSLDLMEEAADRIVALEAERDRLAADNERLRVGIREAIATLDHAETVSVMPWLAVHRAHDGLKALAAGSTDSSTP